MAKNLLNMRTKQIKVRIASCCCTDPARKISWSVYVSLHQHRVTGDTIVSTHMIDGGTEGFKGSVM